MLNSIKTNFLLIFLFISSSIFAQNATVEGYVFEANNRGYLNLVKISIVDKASNYRVNTAVTDTDGYFTVELPIEGDYEITAEKDIFEDVVTQVSTKGIAPGAKVFVKIKMGREPGYLFDVTLAEKWDGKSQVDAIQGALIEIYNNTKDKEELVLKDHPNPYFKFTFEKGNHYTVMVRKKGYFTKRMEAYVDIDGCILCFDGLDEVSPAAPGASDNLTAGNQMGTIVSNVELTPIVINEGIVINNIYYDLAKWDIRPDAAEQLDKLIVTLKSNPTLVVELGSHTDARGSDGSNMSLSEKRAKSAVEYIIENGEIERSRIYGKGYGESELVNDCKDGVKCSERKHQENRRTELKIVGIRDEDPFDGKSLAAIIRAENFEETLADIQNQEVVQIMPGQDLPDEIRRQIEGESVDTGYTPPSTSNAGTTYNTDILASAPTSPPQSTYESVPPTNVVTSPPPRPAQTQSQPEKEPFKDQASHEFDFVEAEQQVTSNYATSGRGVEHEVSTQYISRPPKSLPLGYSGYKIEFFTNISELPLSHEIFSKHGNITIEQRKDGRIAYLLGDFKNKEVALGFLNDIMLRQYSTARVIKYVNGRRSRR